ncbi:two component transcriptional regulator, LytTR family [Dyella jiangningensis]|uniref:LytR/AlgR family response regulator transcription factor n=2 Tax=Gammaproteobacteria TaxID=1236 RepID=UPI00088D6BDC|nr:LytTR family DNA-binding domain-containing protein [Dyella sp. AtDHG13]PXV54057.1 LytTR family two component transcriptional regulator [Dyella sp. AtDHG13]SDL09584.1 two component transcriptional regulator, LytTR family [Dyella jiangningensis]
MIRALIADDEAPAREKLAHWLAEQPGLSVVGSVEDGLSAAQCIEELRPDVVFLDIQMPTLSGLQVAAQLEPSNAPLIVFVTAYDEHAVKAFELNAVDYLLKPYDRERLAQTVQRVRGRLVSHETGAAAVAMGRARAPSCERLLVPDRERLQLIDAASIEWLEADDNYVHVHAGGRDYLLRRTLQDLLSQLGEQRFVRIHRSTAVNLACIASLAPLFKGDYDIQLHNGRVLRLSRRYREALFARMGR